VSRQGGTSRGRFLGEVAGLTSASLAVTIAWSEGKPMVGRHVSGRNPAPPVLSLAAVSE
jgi:hypothetical protein